MRCEKPNAHTHVKPTMLPLAALVPPPQDFYLGSLGERQEEAKEQEVKELASWRSWWAGLLVEAQREEDGTSHLHRPVVKPDAKKVTFNLEQDGNYKGNNMLKKEDLSYKQEGGTSPLHRQVVKPDATVMADIDEEKMYEGSPKEDWESLVPKETSDPDDKKTSDWAVSSKTDDPEDNECDSQVEQEVADLPKGWRRCQRCGQPSPWHGTCGDCLAEDAREDHEDYEAVLSAAADAEETSSCPQGHHLRPKRAREANQWECDLCGRMIRRGATFGTCKRCDWAACTSCVPTWLRREWRDEPWT